MWRRSPCSRWGGNPQSEQLVRDYVLLLHRRLPVSIRLVVGAAGDLDVLLNLDVANGRDPGHPVRNKVLKRLGICQFRSAAGLQTSDVSSKKRVIKTGPIQTTKS